MFEAHQIVFANGSLSESSYPGMQALSPLSCPALSELVTLFPDLMHKKTAAVVGTTARNFLPFSRIPAHSNAIRIT